ncbi:MAG: AtpZ/AtpI family protein [Thermodesulfobacteriota bacterium]
MKKKQSTWQVVGDGLQLGASIVFAILIGAAVGYWIDGKLATFPVFSIIFFLLGIAAAASNVWKSIRKDMPGYKGDAEERKEGR